MKSDPRDYKLDVAGLPRTESPLPSRPYLSVLFNCCRIYQRVYKDADGAGYTGRCPKCLRTIRFVIGPGGAPGRSFVVE